jgi:hypothetical protein
VIYASLHGAREVVFQDYKREAIEKVTIPNTILNECKSASLKFCALSCDRIPSEIPGSLFDFVLASETIYRKEQLPHFAAAFHHLVKPMGRIIIDAKRMYFGLSGSVLDLIELVKDNFNHELHEIKDRSAYRRDILVLRAK